MEIELILIGSFIFLVSAMLQGLSGFGFSILAIPLITLFISPRTAVPVLILFSMIINIVVLYSTWKEINLRKIWILLFFAIIAMPLGAHLLVILNENTLKIFIGCFIFVFGLLLLLGFKKQFKHEKLSMIPIGLISGLLGGSISISGPPIILFMANKGVEKHAFRGNLAIYFFLLNIFTIPVYFLNGLFTKEVFSYSVVFFPGLLAGVIAGNLLSHKIKEDHFKKLILILLILMGILSLISGLRTK